MAKVLFITSDFPQNGKGNLYFDLVTEFLRNQDTIDVIVPQERKNKQKSIMIETDNLRVYRAKFLNFRGKVSIIEKGIATLIQGYFYKRIVKKYFHEKYDIVVCATLPISYNSVFKYLKKKHNTFTYLLHKDIFPQSAIDLGILSSKAIMYKVFKRMESRLYLNSDKIGVMSNRNIEYLLSANPYLPKSKFEVCVNSVIPKTIAEVASLKSRRQTTRDKYGLPQNKLLFVYGGNISRAQGIEFIISILPEFDKISEAHLVFVGSGNEFDNLKSNIKLNEYKNTSIISKIEKSEFDILVAACDVGLVFLDYRFTIANIPSRSLTHMEFQQPILAATDEFTDFKEFIVDNDIGLWSPSNNITEFIDNVNRYIIDKTLIYRQGINARSYLEEKMNTTVSYSTIMKNIDKEGK